MSGISIEQRGSRYRVVRAADRDRLASAARRSTHWTARRDELIRQAVTAGASRRAVAELVGLSHTAVANIVKRAPRT